MNILERIRQNSLAHPDRPAVVSGDEKLTWGELEQLSTRLAAHLEQAGRSRPRGRGAGPRGCVRPQEPPDAGVLSGLCPFRPRLLSH